MPLLSKIMNIKNILIVGIVILGLAGLFLINNKNFVQNSGKKQVTASFYPLYYFVSQIGGDKIDVKNITPAGSEPHDYEPTAQEIARIETSDLLVLNGSVEAWGNKIRNNLKDTNVRIVEAGGGLLTKELTEEGEKMRDPHIWLDPQLAKKQAQKITEGLIAIDPVNKMVYQENLKSLDIKFDQLDHDYKAGLSNCTSRDFITSHEAFAYLAQRYNLNQVAISGISPDEEPSAQELSRVAEFARANNVKYIFFETLVSPKLSETIANEVGAQTLVLDPIEGISDDDVVLGKNYFTVMEDNLKNLRIALGCSN